MSKHPLPRRKIPAQRGLVGLLERVGPVPKRSHGWVVPDTVSPRTTLVSPLPGRRGMDLAISGAEVFLAVVLYCLANRRLDNE